MDYYRKVRPYKKLQKLTTANQQALDIFTECPSYPNLIWFIDNYRIPEAVYHHYALDVVERSLSLHKELPDEFTDVIQGAVDVKRLWMEGKAQDSDLYDMFKRVQRIKLDLPTHLFNTVMAGLYTLIGHMVAICTVKEHMKSVADLVEESDCFTEIEWLCSRMLWWADYNKLHDEVDSTVYPVLDPIPT